MIGNFPVKAIEWGLGYTSEQSGSKEQIAVLCEITQGEHSGQRYTWYGYFHDADNRKRAFKALRALGWKSEDIVKLEGLGEAEAQGVFKEEADPRSGDVRTKLAFINPLIGLALKSAMTPEQKGAFAARMRGEIIATAGASPRPPATSSTSQPKNGMPATYTVQAQGGSPNGPPPPTDWADDEIPF